jgi:hypothetical protein
MCVVRSSGPLNHRYRCSLCRPLSAPVECEPQPVEQLTSAAPDGRPARRDDDRDGRHADRGRRTDGASDEHGRSSGVQALSYASRENIRTKRDRTSTAAAQIYLILMERLSDPGAHCQGAHVAVTEPVPDRPQVLTPFHVRPFGEDGSTITPLDWIDSRSSSATSGPSC